MKESDLIQHLRSGNALALTCIVEQYAGYVSAILRRSAGGVLSDCDAEEGVADVFYILWTHARKVQPNCLKPYLAAIARNKGREYRRKATAAPEIVPLDDESIDVDEAAWAAFSAVEQQSAFRAMLDALTPEDRAIFIRYYECGQRIENIAGAMQMNPSTVKSRLKRGRELLKTELTKRGVCK